MKFSNIKWKLSQFGNKLERTNWYSFYPKWDNMSTKWDISGYFDPRPMLHIQISTIALMLIIPILSIYVSAWFLLLMIPALFKGWGTLYLYIPYDTGRDECEPGSYGLSYHDSTLWLATGPETNGSDGSRNISWYMPWDFDWVRTSNLKKDGQWEHEVIGDRKDFYNDKWKDILWSATHEYKYTLKSGNVQNVNAVIKVTQMEWRMRALKWTSLFNKVRTSIDINFDSEVGEQSGSWKGGTLGCGYDVIKKETPLDALRRMEKERKF